MLHLNVAINPASIPNSMNDHALKPLPLLYTYRRCPYAMRARMALLVAKRDFDAHEIDLRNKPAAMLALSPKGTVPVLQLEGGRVLDQSWDIMRWALDTDATQPWWRLAQTAQNLALLRCNDGDFKRHLDRYKYPQRHALDEEGRVAARSDAVASLLVPLDAALRSQNFLGGSRACACDLAIFPFVRQFAAVEPHWFEAQKLPALHAWLTAWLGSALFEACMVKPTPQLRPQPL